MFSRSKRLKSEQLDSKELKDEDEEDEDEDEKEEEESVSIDDEEYSEDDSVITEADALESLYKRQSYLKPIKKSISENMF